MRVIRSLRRLPGLAGGCAVTIGNFDGLHLGHQAIVARLRESAAALGVPAAIMTFEPMPQMFFDPDGAPPRLSSLREKMMDARRLGIDLFVCARFDQAFAQLSPDTFLDELIDRRLGACAVMVGEDFRFGYRRAGDIGTLRAFAKRRGIELMPQPQICMDGERVSSTRVRRALAAGQTRDAARLLGHDYRISARVVPGERLGRTLGFPTVNLPLSRASALRYGVYAVTVRLADDRRVSGAASFGVRPTVDGTHPLLEIHLLDFSDDLYGQRIDVSFTTFIRDEIRFDSLAALTEQMHRDVVDVRLCLEA